jgi:hypothetical protein
LNTARSFSEDTSSMPVFLTRNGQAVPCELGEKEWLAQAPRGAYTTARTVGGTSIFKLSPHITRMANSARLMMEADQQPLVPALTDPELLVGPRVPRLPPGPRPRPRAAGAAAA